MLVLVVLATISGALSFQWTSSNILANGTVVQVCDGDNLTLNWTFNLTSSEQLQLMEWRRSFQGKRTSLAIYHDEEFVKKPGGERLGVEFLPNAGLFLPSVTVSDSGYYEVHLSVLDPRVFSSQTALLQVSVTPATIDGSLHAYILPVADFQAITGTWHVQLGCGKFLSLGHPAVTVVWNTPSKQMVNSTSFTNNTFILNLANPVEEGDYSCLLERTSPAVECLDRHSPLRHEATVRVHGINTRLSLIEGGLEALREETINLSRPVKDLLDVVSKVDVKVTLNEKKLNSINNKTENLTSKVYHLENSNEQLTGVVSSINNKTENLTSKVYHLENSNEQLTGVVSSINNKTENLTSKVYNLENSNEQLTGVVSSIQRESSRDKIVMNNITYELQRNDKDIVREVTKLHNMTYDLQAKENDILRQVSKFQNENENNSVIVLGRLSELENYVKDLLRTNKNITNMFLGHETKIKEITAFNTLLKISGARIPVSCADVQHFDKKSGVHTLYLKNFTINVFCDQQTDNGGWTVIQRRQDGSVDFYRKWEDYEVGFGNLTGEFWIGLSQLYQLTKDQKSKLRVDLTDFDGSTAYAVYDKFYISGAADNYTLHVQGHRGNAGDSLGLYNLMQFTTYDRDNDKSNYSNCAQSFHGAWWYKACHSSNLNGRYKSDGAVGPDGVAWYRWKNDFRSFKRVEMKIKS